MEEISNKVSFSSWINTQLGFLRRLHRCYVERSAAGRQVGAWKLLAARIGGLVGSGNEGAGWAVCESKRDGASREEG